VEAQQPLAALGFGNLQPAGPETGDIDPPEDHVAAPPQARNPEFVGRIRGLPICFVL
jgi:hypothetical protein